MKILVVGIGYVGLVSATCFAEMGNDVWCVDSNSDKINRLIEGEIPIYEPGLGEMVKNNADQGRLVFMTSVEKALERADICFIAVGTPSKENGEADLQSVFSVAEQIGNSMTRHVYVVNKSTVPVGTAAHVKEVVQKKLDDRKSSLTFDVISNPEFLKEGNAIEDCMRPDRVIIGTDSEKAEQVMKELYLPYIRNSENFISMDILSAEMTKYAANAMLATKISFINEISNICERIGADINKVRRGIGSDKRIGTYFIYAGCGYGGSCFPKDVQALIATSNQNGYVPKLLEAVEEVNFYQKKLIVQKVKQRFQTNLDGFTFAIWGLTFKPDTDDMRESPAITIIHDLLDAGAKIKVYDPKASELEKKRYIRVSENLEYVTSKYTALTDADALLLITEWKEFRSPDMEEIKQRLKRPIIFDGRNQYEKENMKKYGFEYYPIGVSVCKEA